MHLLLLTALLNPSPAVAADQFDLVCMFGKTQVRYRLDLVRNEACKDECSRIWKMGDSSAGEIRLMDTPRNYPAEVPQTMIVNRQSGVLEHWIGGGYRPVIEHAQCEAAQFTGFPAAKF